MEGGEEVGGINGGGQLADAFDVLQKLWGMKQGRQMPSMEQGGQR